MKKLILFVLFTLPAIASMACPACEKQQPGFLRGITHGAGYKGFVDMIGFWVMTALVLATLYYSVKWLIKPGEKEDQHIKRIILND